MSNEIQQCRDEQKRCAQHIIDGGEDTRGAAQGMSDWFAEEILRTYHNSDETSEANS